MQDWATNNPFAAGVQLDLEGALAGLKPTQRRVLSLRNGLAGGEQLTWKEVGAPQNTEQLVFLVLLRECAPSSA